MRPNPSLGSVILIYASGLATGTQSALYLLDTWDDGVSEPLSGLIALAFLAASAALIAASFRRSREG
jgi:hypothetical protein